MNHRDAARRLIVLVDEMYNHNVKFYFTAEMEIDALLMKENMSHDALSQKDSSLDHDFFGAD